MQLSPNFTLVELTTTQTGLPNVPSEAEISRLRCLAKELLQPIRDKWGAIRVSSGYRCLEVNRAIGGSKTSQHMLGEAADIEPIKADIDDVFRWIVNESKIFFGQVIRESAKGKDWIHISLPRVNKPNLVALTYDGKEYKPYAG